MDHWPFILGAYAVTAILVAAEIVAVVSRGRSARSLAGPDDGDEAHRRAHPERTTGPST